MALSLREMLTIPALRNLRVLAGDKGLDARQVSSVTVMDAPDPYRWIQGGEFVVTSGFIFRDDPLSLAGVVRQLNERQASGFGIKVSRYIKVLPDAVLRLADELDFPLLEIPFDFAYRDVIDPVLSSVVNRQARQIKFSEQVLKSFSKMVARGAGEEEICSSLKKFTRCDLAFCNTTFGEVHIEASLPFTEKVKGTPLPELLRKNRSVKIAISDRVYGYLVFDLPPSPSTEDEWFIPVSHARTALLLCLQKRLAHAETERRYRSEFVLDILTSNFRFEKELWNRASLFEWDLRGPVFVVVIDIDNYKRHFGGFPDREVMRMLEETKRRIFTLCSTVIRPVFPGAPFAEMSDSVAYILPAPDGGEAAEKRLCPLLEKILETVSGATGQSVSIGIGRVKPSVFQCAESYREARKGLEMVRSSRGPGRIAFWNHLGVNKLLFSLSDPSAADDFCGDILSPLLNLKEPRRKNLLETLEALAESNWSPGEAARLLGLHQNTVKVRLRKIRELLDFSPSSAEHRLRIALALKILSLKKEETYPERTKFGS